MLQNFNSQFQDDRTSNIERRPALRKRKMLSEVKAMLIRVRIAVSFLFQQIRSFQADLAETMMDNGMLSAVSEWLAPLPDKSLPALEIRTTILKILQSFNRLEAVKLRKVIYSKKEDLEHPETVRSRQSGDAPLQAPEGDEREQRNGRQIDPRMVQTHLPAGY